MKNLIFVLVIFATIKCFSEDLWKPSSGLSGKINPNFISVSKNNIIYAADNNLVFKSKDGGNSWERIEFESTNIVKKLFYYGVMKSDGLGNLYICSEGGVFKVDKNSTKAKLILDFTCEPDIFPTISISYDSKTIIIYYRQQAWISHDYGSNWKQIELDISKDALLFFNNIQYDENYGIIKAYDYTGSTSTIYLYFYYSTNDGLTWFPMKTIPGTNLELGCLKNIKENIWFVNGGIYNFKTKLFKKINIAMIQDFCRSSKGYYLTTENKIFYSSDEGNTWNDITDNLFEVNDNWKYIYAFDVDENGTIYVSGSFNTGFKKSTDNGKTWQKLNINAKVCNVMYLKGINNELYLIDDRNSLYHSTDYGHTWINEPINIQKINQVWWSFDFNAKGELINKDGLRISYSSDKGKHWKYLDTSLINLNTWSYIKQIISKS